MVGWTCLHHTKASAFCQKVMPLDIGRAPQPLTVYRKRGKRKRSFLMLHYISDSFSNFLRKRFLSLNSLVLIADVQSEYKQNWFYSRSIFRWTYNRHTNLSIQNWFYYSRTEKYLVKQLILSGFQRKLYYFSIYVNVYTCTYAYKQAFIYILMLLYLVNRKCR